MDNEKSNDNLPACPVETTLMLIGNKWKVCYDCKDSG